MDTKMNRILHEGTNRWSNFMPGDIDKKCYDNPRIQSLTLFLCFFFSISTERLCCINEGNY